MKIKNEWKNTVINPILVEEKKKRIFLSFNKVILLGILRLMKRLEKGFFWINGKRIWWFRFYFLNIMKGFNYK